MAIIQFTRTERGVHITRRYGTITFTASKGDCWVTGFHRIEADITGDRELSVLDFTGTFQEQILGAWKDHVQLAGGDEALPHVEPKLLRHSQVVHPQLGNVAALQMENLVIKMTRKETTIEAHDFRIVSADHAKRLCELFDTLIEDRIHARQYANTTKD